MDNEDLKNYLRDTLGILIEDALRTKADLQANKEDKFNQGKLMGYVQAISLFEQQAKAFGISPKDLGINIDPERDILT